MVITTAGSQAEANRIAEALVSQKLAACVQASAINSIYCWESEIHKDAEFLLLIKTRAGLYDKVESAIREIHSYDVPEIIQIPITRGSQDYLGWIEENTSETNGVE